VAKAMGLVGFVAGVIVATVAGAALQLHAATAEDVQAPAAEAGVDPTELAGVVNTLQVDPRVYLRSEGLLERAPPPPVSVPVNARVECIIARESGGANIANRRGSGAVGVAQYMVPTFQAHAREMGHTDWSPWVPEQARAVAAHDLAMGRRSQWTVPGCN
jgi:hypothetical protein